MAYPRRCDGCGVEYIRFAGQGNFSHVTLLAQDGGTRSPWAPELPGRLLDIGCKGCGSVVRWDYFGPAGDRRLGVALALLRGPVRDWSPGDGFGPDRARRAAYEPQRRAS